MVKKEKLVIYRHTHGDVSLRADFTKETLWATQAQIAELFGINRTVVTRHIGNILKSGEVEEKSNVQKMHVAHSDKPVSLYSLDIVLAVGYRTNSARAISFRKWATQTLRSYLLKGYALDAKRLKQSRQSSVKELTKALSLIQNTLQKRQLEQGEVDSLLAVIKGYANSWLLLQQYDEGGLVVRKSTKKGQQALAYHDVRPAIDALADNLRTKGEASNLFGNERDGTFKGIVAGIYQAFGGTDVYPSLEEKAAHLLYFIIKDHPFSDGNKRIGSFLFILFLDRNGILNKNDGTRTIDDRALVALALLVAESDPKEKDTLTALITNLLVR